MLKKFLNSPIEFKETIAVMGIEYMFKINYKKMFIMKAIPMVQGLLVFPFFILKWWFVWYLIFLISIGYTILQGLTLIVKTTEAGREGLFYFIFNLVNIFLMVLLFLGVEGREIPVGIAIVCLLNAINGT